MSIAIFLGLTIDKPIEPKHERGFITVMIWCAAFEQRFAVHALSREGDSAKRHECNDDCMVMGCPTPRDA